MDQEFTALLQTFAGDNGWAAQLLAWMAAVRVPMKFIQGAILSVLNRAIERVKATEETDDDALLLRVLKSKPYRAIAFFADLLLSLKLPNAAAVSLPLTRTLSILFLLALPCFFMGCASPETLAYRSIGTVAVSVDGAMKGWGDYVRVVKAEAALTGKGADWLEKEESSVKDAYGRYQQAMRAASLAVRTAKGLPDGEDQLEAALRAVETYSAELILLIRTLTANDH